MFRVHSNYETISTISTMIHGIDTDLQAKFSVSFEQFRILNFIESISPQETTVSALAKQFHANNSATSRKVSALYKQDLIQDHISGDDRRTHWITLTPKGSAVITNSKQYVDEYLTNLESEMVKLLSEDLREA
ncbi:MarR family winged helix-turn-helix transcriptional regulator [Pediococcus siamensis]|uniref:MarR family winged helix-turn-helix transcriptional regulator n=1 Tax=Pediococcus siamensis TaxID=381829 RepID=UPI00399FB909